MYACVRVNMTVYGGNLGENVTPWFSVKAKIYIYISPTYAASL